MGENYTRACDRESPQARASKAHIPSAPTGDTGEVPLVPPLSSASQGARELVPTATATPLVQPHYSPGPRFEPLARPQMCAAEPQPQARGAELLAQRQALGAGSLAQALAWAHARCPGTGARPLAQLPVPDSGPRAQPLVQPQQARGAERMAHSRLLGQRVVVRRPKFTLPSDLGGTPEVWQPALPAAHGMELQSKTPRPVINVGPRTHKAQQLPIRGCLQQSVWRAGTATAPAPDMTPQAQSSSRPLVQGLQQLAFRSGTRASGGMVWEAAVTLLT
ncbi:hypothetical protein CYMTET_38736 [Cymbomonas tetramitiformis]|uniref:Uncharacterized protein n=1 Tax=Cymbomonas tetramitiformis TaxID=36881 RepID=A0AAE0CCT6_9CHLO|nr:hypothetical protein CYMTET_38736 [Cymbomonas tetramitiformis]